MAPVSRRPIEPWGDGVRLLVRVQPRASRTEIAGRHGEAIRVRLNAPPVDGAANEALIRLLSERLGVPRASVHIQAGASGRQKTIEVRGISMEAAAARLGLG